MVTIDALLHVLHVLAAVTWLGGMVFAILALHPVLVTRPIEERIPLIVPVLRRFFILAGSSIAVLAATGAYFYFARLGVSPSLAGSRYGILMTAKFAVTLAMVLVFLRIVFRHYAAASDLARLEQPGSVRYAEIPAHLKSLTALVRVNLVLGTLVVLIVELALRT
ncbi:MAG: CopD family protein [Nitrospirota bacterium]